MAAKQKGLGRGLDVLIKDNTTKQSDPLEINHGPQEVLISKIVTSPWQPRTVFNSESLNELVNSVKIHGILQPLIVRKVKNSFELIAGERRLRAAKEASLSKVPVIVIEASDKKALELALIENLQREDLGPIEEAEGYALLQEAFNLTQNQVADQVGKARASVANSLRLLDLSDYIREQLSNGLLSVGHAKVLLSISLNSDRDNFAKQVLAENLTVRALDKLVKNTGSLPKKKRAEKSDLPNDYLKTLINDLHKLLGTQVRINPSKTLTNGKKIKGCLEIIYHNNDELDRILEIIGYSGK